MSKITESRFQFGFPLASLFVLVGVFAILTAMLGPVVKAVVAGRAEGFFVFVLTLIMVGVLTVLGACVGGFHHRRLWGILVGAIVGAVTGLFVGPLTAVPIEGFPSLVVAGLGGSAALVMIGVIARFTAHDA
jgi:hypothetical protein